MSERRTTSNEGSKINSLVEKLQIDPKRIFQRISDLLRGNEEQFIENDWQSRILKRVNQHDKEAIEELRMMLSTDEDQTWYYSGAGVDLLPLIFSQLNSTHVRVDPGYKKNHMFYRDGLADNFTRPFKNLRVPINLSKEWDEALEQGSQTITIDGKTIIELVGKKTQAQEATPTRIDVIYTNPFSPSPDTSAYKALEIGGFFIKAFLKEATIKSANYLGIPLEDIGFSFIKNISIDKAHFPVVGKVAGTTDGKALDLHIYQKTREITDQEYLKLQVISRSSEMVNVFANFVFAYDYSNLNDSSKQITEDEYADAVERYVKTIVLLKMNDLESANKLIAELKLFFSSDGDFPNENIFYPFGDTAKNIVIDKFPEDVKRNYKKAKEIAGIVCGRYSLDLF